MSDSKKFNEMPTYTSEGVAAAQAALVAAKAAHGENHPAFRAAVESVCEKVNAVLDEMEIDSIRF